METKRYEPLNPILKNFIDFYWTLKAKATYLKSFVEPSPSFDITFNLKESTTVRWSADTKEFHLRGGFISGIRNKLYTIQTDGEIDYFIIRFKIDALRYFVPKEISSLVTEPANLKDVNDFRFLEEKLFEQKSDQDKIKVIETELLKLLFKNANQNKTDEKILKLILNQLHQTAGKVKIKQICNDLDIYYKKLERLFQKNIGISPKQYIKVVRFNTLLENLISNDFNKWSDLAYDAGYFDQSHFIKDFNYIIGKNPRVFYKDVICSKEYFL